jgi:cytochrome c biogenesis protein CcdA/glutaredoxin
MRNERAWKLLAVVAALGVLVAGAAPAEGGGRGDGPDATGDTVELVLFWGEGCPYCAAERAYLDDLAATRPRLVVLEYEVYRDEANRRLFEEMAAEVGFTPRSVPTTFLGAQVWVGFDDSVAASIREAVDAALAAPVPPDAADTPGPVVVESVIDVPFVGAVDVGDRSLLVSTLLIGFVDGVNPCSLWVLSVLLALVLHGGSRRRVIAVGAVFLAVTSAMYGLYIAGLYSALRYVQYLTWIQRVVAVVVGVLGLLQLNDAVAFRRGPSLGVPKGARPEMYRRMRGLADPARSVPVVLGATALLAVGVSLLETPCTLGLPLLWTDLLARSDVSAPGAALLLLVYLAVFLLDELIVFGAVVATMRAVRLQERHGRDLKLVSGVVMVALAVVMVARPTMLETVGGALATFGLAAAIAAAGMLADRRLRHA